MMACTDWHCTAHLYVVFVSVIGWSVCRAKFERLDVQKEYDKRLSVGKDNINLVVIGDDVAHILCNGGLSGTVL